MAETSAPGDQIHANIGDHGEMIAVGKQSTQIKNVYQHNPAQPIDAATLARQDLLLLGPTFGLGSEMIGGAEADLYLDGTILAVKVGRKTGVTRDTMRQLICYAVLSRRYGVDRAAGMPPVEYVGVYIAVAAALTLMAVLALSETKGSDLNAPTTSKR